MLYKILIVSNQEKKIDLKEECSFSIIKNQDNYEFTSNDCKNAIIKIRNGKKNFEIDILDKLEIITINGFNFNHFSTKHRLILCQNTYVTLGNNNEFKFMIMSVNSEFILKKEMKQKTLPFVVPDVCTYPYFTCLMAILTSYANEKEWLYNNYILLWMNITRKVPFYWADFKFKYDEESQQDDYCPLIDKKEMNRWHMHDIINYVRSQINDYTYVFLSIDMFYIDEWWDKEQEKTHFFHQVCIWGYNDADQSLKIADFFQSHYKIISVKYKIFKESYLQYNHYNNLNEDYHGNKIFCLTYKPINYDLDVHHIKNSIYDFLESTDHSLKNYINNIYFKDEIIYGKSCFAYLLKYLDELISKSKVLDMRIFHLLYLFNKIMMDRLEFLMDKGYILYNKHILKDFDDVVQQSKIILNCIIKYNLNCSSLTGSRIITRFRTLIIQEYQLLASLYDIV